MKTLIIGTGYVGLVTGACFASLGHQVVCVDKDVRKIEMLQTGRMPIYELGLTELVQEQLAAGRLRFGLDASACPEAEIALIAVGTPPLPNGEANLAHVFAVVEQLGQTLPTGAVIGTKSTVPVGTAVRISEHLKGMGRGDLKVVSIPEFLREGSAIEDTLHPYRLVFGVQDGESATILERLHEGLQAPMVVCDTQTAEMIKYASNAFLATKISFINEIANICERVDADVSQVAHGMGLDPRIGSSFLKAGLGYGGSCFPKDTRALVSIAGHVDYDFELLRSVVAVNQRQRLEPVHRLREWFGSLAGIKVTLLGVTFKPGTDDIRESPAVDVAEALLDEGAQVQFYDPVAPVVGVQGAEFGVSHDVYESLLGADAAVLVTEWPELLELDWQRARLRMKQPFVFDGRNVLDPLVLQNAGYTFANIGHKSRTFAPMPM